jgi:hypothetical protein
VPRSQFENGGVAVAGGVATAKGSNTRATVHAEADESVFLGGGVNVAGKAALRLAARLLVPSRLAVG